MRQNDMEFTCRHIGERFLPEQFFGCQQVFFHDLQPAPSVETLVDKGVYQRIGILRPPLEKVRRGAEALTNVSKSLTCCRVNNLRKENFKCWI